MNTQQRTLENGIEFAAAGQRMLERFKQKPENHLGLLYSAAEQLAQAAREVNRLIGHIEGAREFYEPTRADR